MSVSEGLPSPALFTRYFSRLHRRRDLNAHGIWASCEITDLNRAEKTRSGVAMGSVLRNDRCANKYCFPLGLLLSVRRTHESKSPPFANIAVYSNELHCEPTVTMLGNYAGTSTLS
jgi:hypothetical protein